MTSETRDPDARLSRAYRDAAGEEPPARLDDAILAAARREVAAGPRQIGSPFVRRWAVPMSIAAVIVVTVSLVTLMQEEGGDQLIEPPRPALPARESARNEAPAPAAALPQPQAFPAPKDSPRESAAAVAKRADRPAGAQLGQAEADRAAAPIVPPPVDKPRLAEAERKSAPAPEPRSRDLGTASGTAADAQPGAGGLAAAPAPAAPESRQRAEMAARESAAEDSIRRQAPARAAGAPPPAAKMSSELAEASSLSAFVRELDRRPPERWLEKIAGLRRDGRTAEADELLAEFRKRFPDHPVPAAAR